MKFDAREQEIRWERGGMRQEGPTCNSNSSSAWKSLPASLLALIQLFKMLHATLCVCVRRKYFRKQGKALPAALCATSPPALLPSLYTSTQNAICWFYMLHISIRPKQSELKARETSRIQAPKNTCPLNLSPLPSLSLSACCCNIYLKLL